MRYVFIGLFLMASSANAENWQPIGKLDSDGGVLLFDAAGVSEVQGLRRAWFKAVYTSDQPIPAEYLASVPANLRSYRSERTLRYFNCSTRTSAVMRYFWDSADEKAGGYFYQKLLTFRAAATGTLDEQMLKTVCEFAGEFADPQNAKFRPPGEESRTARLLRPVDPNDYYPSGSRRRKEEGAPIVQICVDSKGAPLRDPVVTEASGFPDLDAAAVKVAKATRYAAGTENGKALAESCMQFKIRFFINKR